MIVVRQAGVLLRAPLPTSRGLFAQDSAPAAPASPTDQVASPADQVKVLLRPTEIRYVHQESVLLPPTAKIKGLYVNAWAFGSPKLWQLVRLADETEINAFVVDVKDDTGACCTRRPCPRLSRSAPTSACAPRTRAPGSTASTRTASTPSRASSWRRTRCSRSASPNGP